MSGDWKVGDVAMLEVGCHANRHRGLFVNSGWRYGDKWVANDPAIVTARPLVVIDPEDSEQVDRLVRLFWEANTDAGDSDVIYMTAALREFAAPKPPKPAEPQGLGAVVETASGYRWLHAYCDEGRKQWIDKDGRTANYEEIAAVRVLSDGVTTDQPGG